MTKLNIGIAQLRPAWLNKKATTKIVIDAIAEAGRQGIELLAFSETFLSGYPFWVCRTNGAAFGDARQERAYAQFLDEAVEIEGPEITLITEAARDYNVSVYLGMNERGSRAGRGTVWCTLVTIHARKGVIGAHRKLMPTHDERLCWGIGDARDLRTHEFGAFRVGGLNCWENWMPLARNSLYEDGEDVHICVWPGNASVTGNLPYFSAHEGRVWCASVCGLLSLSDVPADFEFYPDLAAEKTDVIFAGGSMILSPQGVLVAEIGPGIEGIIAHEIDMQAIRAARHNFDPAGHYARPDIFRVAMQRHRHGDNAGQMS
jgi:nitrilase